MANVSSSFLVIKDVIYHDSTAVIKDHLSVCQLP